ncbi:MAG: 3'-5' exonuclease, partial [Methanothrix sp.]
MGSTNAQLPDTEDEASEPSSNPTATAALPSPYKPYYFNPERFEHQKAQYLSQLSSLKSFVGAIREYRVGESLNLTHLIEFVDLHQQNDLPISDLSVHISNQQAVSLLTAHKAKGLEFEQLFILGTNQDTWTKGGRGDKLPFPINLTITPEPDLDQDFKRIFYVALTRAKHTIHFSRGAFDAKGKELIPLSYLSSLTPTPVTLSNPDLKQALEVSLQPEVPLVIGPDQKVLLEPLLTKYCLSVTHLNNFLDLKRGGPQAFLEQNLLRYPGPKTNSSSFGTAIHAVLNQIHRTLQASQDRPSVATVLNWFDQFLLAERLLPADHARYLSTGHLELERFYQAHIAVLFIKTIQHTAGRNDGAFCEPFFLPHQFARLPVKAAQFRVRRVPPA